MANISKIKTPDGTTYNVKDSVSGYTTNTGTITSVKTTAGAHTAINVSSGAANFNVPTKTSHLTNDSGFLTSHQTIKQDGVTGASINRFGTCSTAAATAAKTVSITTGTFALEAGATIAVKFSNANTAKSPTLAVNSTAAKKIFVNGAQITSDGNKALLKGTVIFIYDGTQWNLIGNYYDTDTQNVTGVKGNSESSYRTGNVNITAANIGLGNVENKSSATIRGELTSSNVTTALGYTPPTTDTNTTYTLSADTTNNKIKLTPSSGSANSITVPYATTAGSAPASDVYSWAKASTKPSYTASEVGALASTTKYAGSDSAGGAANTVKIKTPTFSSTGNFYSILLDNTSSDVSSSGRASIFGSGVWTTLGLGFPTTGSIKLFTDNGGYNEIRPNSDLAVGIESIQYLPLANGRLLNTQSPVAGSDSYGGPATAANKLINSVTVGTNYNPVYFYRGLPVASKYSFDSGNIASKGTATITGIQRGLIIISRGTAGAGVYFIDNWYGVATAVNNSNFTVTCSSNGTATLKNNHASLQATYFAIYYKQ